MHRALILLLAGCGHPEETELDPCETASCIDSDPNDWHPADITVDWDRTDAGGSVAIQVPETSQAVGFWLGMSETAAGEAGWYDEDGIGPNAHSFAGLSASLDFVDAPEDVILGQTTLFDGGSDGIGDAFDPDGADRLTYLLILRDGPYAGYCYFWGDDLGYYAALDCEAL